MAETPQFKQIQYEFAAHIRNPEKYAIPENIEPRRMKIYSDLFFNNVENFMANTYPVLKRIMPEQQWLKLMRDYFEKHQAHTPLFPEMPREFIKYLENEYQGNKTMPFINELAHYEWVELALSISDQDEDINWDEIDQNGNLLENTPILSPLAWPLLYHYPVHRISEDYIPQEPLQQPVHLLVYRDFSDEVHFMELNPVTAMLIAIIKQQPAETGQQILEHIAEQLQHPQPDIVITAGLQILEDLKTRNVILGVNKS